MSSRTMMAIIHNLGFKTYEEFYQYWADANRRCPERRRADLSALQDRLPKQALYRPVEGWREEVNEILDDDTGMV